MSSPRTTRRTAEEIETICSIMIAELAAAYPMTVRQLFYRLVSRGAIAKTEGEYKQTVIRLCLRLRREGRIPYDWIADNTRWMRKPRSHDSYLDALEDTARTYRRNIWRDQGVEVEIWCEKDALAGVLLEETAPWDVPLFVARGYSSETFLYTTGAQIRASGKETFIYLFGDHDPSGVDARRDLERRLRGFTGDVLVHFETPALLPEQIAKYQLPTRPTKGKDSRAKGWKGESTDLDALPPDVLRAICRNCIERHVDERVLEQTKAIESAERETLDAIWNRMREVEAA